MTRKIGLKSLNDPIDSTTPRPYVLTVDATIFLISHSAAVIDHAKEHRDVLLYTVRTCHRLRVHRVTAVNHSDTAI